MITFILSRSALPGVGMDSRPQIWSTRGACQPLAFTGLLLIVPAKKFPNSSQQLYEALKDGESSARQHD
jgi:hypothetical protein